MCEGQTDMLTSDLGLDQVVPLCADVFEEASDVDGALLPYLLQHAVQDHVRARPAYAGAARQREGGAKISQGSTGGVSRRLKKKKI